ncbi:hypothetical protein [Leifsonia sp. SIMBA_070]|uniref:hypothetical protein n=1 Tax=Leifsonia sp. SIMBA_070 TaxID=3085810 RepID=UPI0039783344
MAGISGSRVFESSEGSLLEQTTVQDLLLVFLHGDHRGFVARVDELLKAGDGLALVAMLTNEHCNLLDYLVGRDAALSYVGERAIEIDLTSIDQI